MATQVAFVEHDDEIEAFARRIEPMMRRRRDSARAHEVR
jgi:hypothetical protein